MGPCPFTKEPCQEDCPLFVSLVKDETDEVKNCVFVWNVTLLIEVRKAVEVLARGSVHQHPAGPG